METIEVRDIVYKTLDFEGPLDIPGKEVRCPECDVFYPASEWTAYDVDCDCCGSHPLLGCPISMHHFDPFRGDGDLLLQLRDAE